MSRLSLTSPAVHTLDSEAFAFASLYEWRQFLKKELLRKRKYRSDFSGKPLRQRHMHEGILTRANVPKNISWHIKIYHEYNCFLLLPEEHIPQPPSREWCILRSYELYGKDAVIEWYYSLPWKKLAGKPQVPFLLT